MEHDFFRNTGFHPRIKSEGRHFPDHALVGARQFTANRLECQPTKSELFYSDALLRLCLGRIIKERKKRSIKTETSNGKGRFDPVEALGDGSSDDRLLEAEEDEPWLLASATQSFQRHV